MKITHALIVAIFPLLVVSAEYGFAQSVVFHTDSTVYSPEDPLLVYGTVSENDPLILRLFAPDGTIKGFEQISADIDGISYCLPRLVSADGGKIMPVCSLKWVC